MNAYSVAEIISLLESRGEEQSNLFARAKAVKKQYVGDHVYLRALIEYSNQCEKNCYYCGIRAANKSVSRYVVSDEDVLLAARFAYENQYGSVVLQAGECSGKEYVLKIEYLIKEILRISNNELGITLSLGEQSKETYQRWRDAGAKRYLLRIESSNSDLYTRIHPESHSHAARLACMNFLKELDYQVGTGVMIGLPFQTMTDLANDLLFFKSFDVDMVGMGPYMEHSDTPLYAYQKELMLPEERYRITLNMLAILRLMMPSINIAATTAMGSIVANGREKALEIAANVLMPNMTPFSCRENYFLYDDKLCIKESYEDNLENLKTMVERAGCSIGFGLHGDSLHYKDKK